ncbi:MAG TPA: Gfo/Idh/MocA family oxidoreductase, partial [Vicinamibacterales bacterium]|nr:Gfo/Idh/MocA family oxidoreductase [Vicinamibacterales bacterium]
LLTATAAMQGPVRGGPVRLGFIGVGGQGRALLTAVDPSFGDVRAVCDINPDALKKSDEILLRKKQPAAAHYVEWADMLQKEDIEAVITAVPLWAHADITVACLNAGKHVLCEKMMAWDVAGCERMTQAAEKNTRILEIGYQRRYNGVYQSAHEGIIKKGLLGDIFHVRMVWHRNGNWRRNGGPPVPGYDPSKWGYPTWEHLWNWRLYWKYSQGLFAELASHQLNAANWFLGSAPIAVTASGGIYRFNDGREVPDHIYAMWEYPGGRTVTYSSLESNALENRYEVYFGTKGTLLVRNETEALLFEEGSAAARQTGVQVSPREGVAAAEASETRPGSTAAASKAGAAGMTTKSATPMGASARPPATRQELSRFCAAVRGGAAVACGPLEASHSARACIRGNEAIKQKKRLEV